jgi:hypothetical protein
VRAWLAGRCVQGTHSGDTHVDELAHSYDWALPVGTPVLASADGVVAAAVGYFRKGSRSSKEMRTRANFVAIRHGNGLYSRYYHLRHDGVCVQEGERVLAGAVIGRSGNTGFSGGPHLHWDVVDALPTETATLALHEPTSGRRTELPCVAGCFSAALPPLNAPIVGDATLAEPADASAPELTNRAEHARGAILLVERCKEVDFIDKARRAEAAGAAAVVVVNYAEAGPALLSMGIPSGETRRRVGIPALMTSHAGGEAIRKAIRDAKSRGDGNLPRLAVGRSEHFRARPAAVSFGGKPPTSEFVPVTVPARFYWPGREKLYLPCTGEKPPREVQRAEARDSQPALPLGHTQRGQAYTPSVAVLHPKPGV